MGGGDVEAEICRWGRYWSDEVSRAPRKVISGREARGSSPWIRGGKKWVGSFPNLPHVWGLWGE